MTAARGCALIAVLLALGGSVPVVSAQTTRDSLRPSLQAGDRVRLQVPGYGKGLFRATIVGVTRDTLHARTHPNVPVVAIPLDSVLRLQVADGSRARTAHWGLRGGAIGAAAGGFIGAARAGLYKSRPCPVGDPVCNINTGFQHSVHHMAEGALIGALAGGVLGALVGTRIKEPTWRDVAPAGLTIGVITGRGVGMRISATF